MERSSLVVRGGFQVLQKEWSQVFGAREVRRDNAEQPPSPLASLGLVVGRLLHELTVNFVPQTLELMAVLKKCTHRLVSHLELL